MKLFDFHLEDAAGNRYWGRTGYASGFYALETAGVVLKSSIPGKYVDRAVVYLGDEVVATIMRKNNSEIL